MSGNTTAVTAGRNRLRRRISHELPDRPTPMQPRHEPAVPLIVQAGWHERR
jgi:hypothetical protein